MMEYYGVMISLLDRSLILNDCEAQFKPSVEDVTKFTSIHWFNYKDSRDNLVIRLVEHGFLLESFECKDHIWSQGIGNEV